MTTTTYAFTCATCNKTGSVSVAPRSDIADAVIDEHRRVAFNCPQIDVTLVLAPGVEQMISGDMSREKYRIR